MPFSQACKDSIFTTRWKQEFIYTDNNKKHLSIVGVDLNAVVRHCLLIPYDKAKDEYIEVWSRDLWADQFLDPARIVIDNSQAKSRQCKRKSL